MNGARNRRGLTSLALVLALVAGAASAADTYYRWRDAQGNLVHSDRPPPKGVEYESISTTTNIVQKVEAEAEEAAAEAETAEAAAADSAGGGGQNLVITRRDPALCEQARANLETLETAARIRIREDDGSLRFLNEEEKAAQKTTAQDMVTRHCE